MSLKNYTLIFSGLFTLFLGGCQTEQIKQKPVPLSHSEEKKRNFGKFFGNEFLSFGGNREKKPSDAPLAPHTNKYLWQASLDVVGFIPLASVDSPGGIIITEWYDNQNNPKERLKVTIHVRDEKLRTHAIKATIHKKKRLVTGHWKSNGTDADRSRKLEDLILLKARELRVQDEES